MGLKDRNGLIKLEGTDVIVGAKPGLGKAQDLDGGR